MFSLVGSYLIWHYSIALAAMWSHLKNFVTFFYHFFSIPVLLKTFFAPWRRLGERYPQGLDIVGFLSTLFINTMMRGVGAIIRLILISFGLLVLLATIVFGIIFFAIWILLPLIALVILISGIRLLFI